MKIILNDNYLTIHLDILEKIGAAKGSLYIPYESIVSVLSEPPHDMLGFKLVGTNIPKILELGTYLVGTQKQFWYVKRRKNPYLILVLKSNFYSKIILEIKDGVKLSQQINDKIEMN